MKPFAMGFLFFCIFSASTSLWAGSQDTPMTADELGCLQKMIYFNECSGRVERMVTWNTDEDFPSFGLGHFIWYPQGKKGPYRALFPEFLSFLEAQKTEIPAWIKALPTREAPWQNREEFLSDLSSERMTALKNFLDQTQRFQTQFIIYRVKGILPRMLAAIPEGKRPEIELKFNEIENDPKGMFALIDYVNFKGEGILETERSQGQGWGLLQVLEEMRTPEKKEAALEEFVRAAKKVLENRVKNAPPEKDCSKRLGGWKARVKNYLKIKC
ncbi:MAG: hypothetical protein WCJ71_05240 [Candidatus Omnitrophota bacterium]